MMKLLEVGPCLIIHSDKPAAYSEMMGLRCKCATVPFFPLHCCSGYNIKSHFNHSSYTSIHYCVRELVVSVIADNEIAVVST
jgi:hypothetical protein